jgi:hypothetical protein
MKAPEREMRKRPTGNEWSESAGQISKRGVTVAVKTPSAESLPSRLWRTRGEFQGVSQMSAEKPSAAPGGNPSKSGTVKDPEEWTTGDEPMTGAQESYLNTLARQAAEEVGTKLTKAKASKKINEHREKTGIERAAKTSNANGRSEP